MTLQEKWRGGFTLHFDSDPMFDEEWLLDDRHVKDDELRFLGYDANMCALANLSTAPEKHRREVVQQASLKLKNVNADIWLDDCKIKLKSKE